MKISFKDKFQLQFSKALEKYRADLDSVGISLSDAESHYRFRGLWAGSSEMCWCDLDDQGPKTYTGHHVWCTDHDMPATHCGTDGDTPVCVVHAQAAGCNCCPINYDEELRAEAKARFGSPYVASNTEERLRKVFGKFGLDEFMSGQIIFELQAQGLISLTVETPEEGE